MISRGTSDVRRHRTLLSGLMVLAVTAVMSPAASAGARAEGVNALARTPSHAPVAGSPLALPTRTGILDAPSGESAPNKAAAFDLNPPYVPGAVSPVPGADGGVGAWALERGVDMIVEPYLGMSAGDVISGFWGWDQVVAQHVVTQEEADSLVRLSLHVPREYIRDGLVRVRYTVHQVNGTAEQSADLTLRVKTTLPGGPRWQQPTEPGLPGDVARYGVDAEAAQQGVPVVIGAYTNMTEGDTIALHWGTGWVEHTVGMGEVGKAVTLNVPREVIAAAGDGGEVPIAYQLQDVVGNRSSWSEQVRVRVYLEAGDRGPLVAPEVPAQVNGLGLVNVPVKIPVLPASGIKAGDIIHLWWGSVEVRHTVRADEVQARRITVNVGLLVVLDAGGGDLKVSYGVTDSAGAGVSSSPESPVHVSLLGL